MEVKVIEADSKVREDIGKVAVTRGPIVYCLEETDNGKDLHMLYVDMAGTSQVADEKICGVDVKAICMDGYRQEADTDNKADGKRSSTLYRVASAKTKNKTELKYIPYYMWANRAENEMQVWTRIL